MRFFYLELLKRVQSLPGIHHGFIISIPPLHVANTPFLLPASDFPWGAGAEAAEGSLGRPGCGEQAGAMARATLLPGRPG